VASRDDVDAALARLAREESGRVLALLARQFRSLDLADEAVQDALASAASTWPERGVPSNPPAWLLTVARNKAIDRLRRRASARRRMLAAAPDLIVDVTAPGSAPPAMIDDTQDAPVDDDQLRLMLLCCHPALDRDAQVTLTLRLVGGLTTAEIAAGLLVQEATLAQRIVRAKRKIRDAGIPLTIPAALAERIDVVLGVLYLIFNEGYLSRTSDAVVRTDLIDEAIRLTEAFAPLVDDHPEVLGLLALERFNRARASTRTDGAGDLVLLEDQDRSQWDHAEIADASAVLLRALRQMQPGPYQLQAIIARYHATARTAEEVDWQAIAGAYAQLAAMTRSPVVQLNRAVAVSMAEGAAAGLLAMDEIVGLDRYHLFHAARGELLVRADRAAEAAEAFATAQSLTTNEAERRHLARRQAVTGG
jgi:RNA polymerase sigma-70 factor (ECF subfamily)